MRYKILVSVGFLIAAFAVSFGLNSIHSSVVSGQVIPPELVLKADKAHIIDSAEKDDVRCEKRNCAIVGRMVEYTFATNKEVPNEAGENVRKRGGNYRIFDKGKDEKGNLKEQGVFYPQQIFTQEVSTGRWFGVKRATTTVPAFQLQTRATLYERFVRLFTAYANSGTFNPAAGENSPVDGWVRCDNQANWATAYTCQTGTALNDLGNDIQVEAVDSAGLVDLYRGFVLFDTSSIGAGSSITSAVLSMTSRAVVNSQSAPISYDSIATSSPASNSILATGDFPKAFSNIQLTNHILVANIVSDSSTYNDFTFYATSTQYISQTGISKFSVKTSNDFENFAPATNKDFLVIFSSADSALPIPKLVVNWTTGGGGGYYNVDVTSDL